MIIYEITCLVDNRRYIGRTKQPLERRWLAHWTSAYYESRTPLHSAMRQQGRRAFVVREVACAMAEPDLLAVEQAIIRQEGTTWPAGFNVGTESRFTARARRARAAECRPPAIICRVAEHADDHAKLSCGNIIFRRDVQEWPHTAAGRCWQCILDSRPRRRKPGEAASAILG